MLRLHRLSRFSPAAGTIRSFHSSGIALTRPRAPPKVQVPTTVIAETSEDAFRHIGKLGHRFRLARSDRIGSNFLQATRDGWWSDTTIDPTLMRHMRHMNQALSSNHTSRVFEIFQEIQTDKHVKGLHIEVFNALLQACAILKQPEAYEEKTQHTHSLPHTHPLSSRRQL